MAEVEKPIISGKKFAEARNRLMLTQEEFAPLIGMSLANVRRVERKSTTAIRPVYFRNLAKVLEITLEELTEKLKPEDESQGEPFKLIDAIAQRAGLTPQQIAEHFGFKKEAASRSEAAEKRVSEKKKRRGS